MSAQEIINQATTGHTRTFQQAPTVRAWAPGRIEVLGNHTDYNEGTVLSAAIDLGHCVALSPSPKPGIRLQALDVDAVADFDLTTGGPVDGPGWANYVKGVCYLLQQECNTAIDGLDITFFGSIPMGSGLSSSAALEVSTATAVLAWLERTLDPLLIAQLCRRAEHEFAGANCGLLDQFSSLFGQAHCLIHSDFRSLEVQPVELPHDITFLVINPRVPHRLADSPYNERRARCEQAAQELAQWLPDPVRALRDVTPAAFAAQRAKIDPAAAQRAAHVIGEIDRVDRAMTHIRAGDMEAFGQCLFDSHASSADNFENSTPELDAVVEAARHAGALGARLSGGGFGGSAIAMVRQASAAAVTEALLARLQPAGLTPDVLAVTPSSGATVLPVD